MNRLTVFSVIRNGVRNGYPFVEAYGSWLEHCDRVFILDGESVDGTQHVLRELARVDDRVQWTTRPWPVGRPGGGAIADFTNLALELARDGAERLMYVQADEIYTADQQACVRESREGALEFAGCINFWNSLETIVGDDFPLVYLRSFPADAPAQSVGDGFTFTVEGTPVTRLEERILHFGWCFPVNILQKHVSHSELYSDKPAYVARGQIAQMLLRRGIYDQSLLNALLPEYRPAPYIGELPPCTRHLVGCDVYDPYIGLGLLRDGVRW
jgi:hypothetical protein